jgi:hypothetical protein
LVKIMVDADFELLGLSSPGEGKIKLKELCNGWHCWDDQIISMEPPAMLTQNRRNKYRSNDE